MPISDNASGAIRAATAMSLLGCSTGVTAAFAGYPLAGGQTLRYLLASLILLPLARREGPLRPRLTGRELTRLICLAGSGLYAFNLLLIAALHRSDPAVVGSVVGCTPLLLAVLGPLLAGRRPQLRLLAAAGVVVAGAAVTQGFGPGDALGFAYALGTLACEAAFSLLAVPLLPRLGPVRVSTYVTVLAVPMFAVTALAMDGTAAVRMPSGPELVALLYLATLLTCGAFLLWYGALERLGADRAGLFAGLVPVTAAVSGAVTGTGALRSGELVGAVLVGVGVCVGVRASTEQGGRRARAGRSDQVAGREESTSSRHCPVAASQQDHVGSPM
ncbi:DMT family transporter [Streptomyces kaniharaensis]|uniref:DMT family transporter n=1 Tax=Streptomyces kaniharaensis TaxID=212423 RepID=A0A6N7KKP8_9ACTN|nr:EamA family transporter [Streptomyces kaniharaensis]MQS11345.1 DMT family transporter [Streptomyces kaniharaensis]